MPVRAANGHRAAAATVRNQPAQARHRAPWQSINDPRPRANESCCLLYGSRASLVAVAVFFWSAECAVAATLSWNDPISGSFGNAQRWTPNAVPGVGDTVVFDNVDFDALFLNSDQEISRFLADGAVLQLTAGTSDARTLTLTPTAATPASGIHLFNGSRSPSAPRLTRLLSPEMHCCSASTTAA